MEHTPGRWSFKHLVYAAAIALALLAGFLAESTPRGLLLLGGDLPFAFVLFALVLLGVALMHERSFYIAVTGALVISIYTALFCPEFAWPTDQHTPGMWGHVLHEAEHTLLNLGGLLLGFVLLADMFEHSGLPGAVPRVLPKSPLLGAFGLLAIVWVFSSFLDNIAAAMIGGVLALQAFRGNVTVGYLAAIVAASNAGGAWSVLGDTTTTMMWIDGVTPGNVFHCIVASTAALLVFGFIASRHQIRVQKIEFDATAPRQPIDGTRLALVAVILAGAIIANFTVKKPFVGVWAALLVGSLLRRPAWGKLPAALPGTLFLLSLVWCASLMPVEKLPAPSATTAFGLGVVSAFFDNIPLTKLALEQGGYDWGLLAYAVGFGGSMIWFGSSAGVALSSAFPQIRNTGRYLWEGWPVALAYVIGFAAQMATVGWLVGPSHHTH